MSLTRSRRDGLCQGLSVTGHVQCRSFDDHSRTAHSQ